ncbi:MAG: hypothetical protein M3137_12050, partial [Actinomycetota bacterium]|nr:hypothetical protein [Actinomycetota bacterium]
MSVYFHPIAICMGGHLSAFSSGTVAWVNSSISEGRSVGAGGKLTPLRRLRFDPPWAVAEASGGLVSLA